jgi:multidrug efflux pump subunit AcrA (membrane-fusion protein)
MLPFLKKHYIGVLVSSLILVAIIILIISNARNSVDYVSPRHGPIVEAIYGLGKVKSDKFYEVKLAIIKSVKTVFVNEGDSVSKNDRLIEMDGGLVFYAPFDGTVTNIAYRESQPVFPQQTILRMEDITNKYIEVSLEQQAALRVKKNQKVTIVFESIRGEQISGTVSSIFPRDDEFLAHIAVQNLGENILPGMTADIAIEINRKENALLIPLSGISNGQIRILRDGKKLVIPVKVGGVDGNWAEVTEGDLLMTDQVLVRKAK